MNARNILTVYGKELRDSLRDRRTLVSMILIPLLMIPGIMMVAVGVSARVMSKARAEVPSVMLLGDGDSPAVHAALAANRRIRLVPAAPDWRQRIADKQLRAAVELPPGFDAALARGAAAEVKIYDYEGELRSGFAVGELRTFFNEYRQRTVAARLAARGLPAELIRPFEVRTENVAPPEKVGGNLVGGLIPYLVILLCFTGAMYPAMDLTAGEKERGTMETILCSPVARGDLVLGKFLMVLTASLATGLISLISSGATFLARGLVMGGAPAARALPGLPAIDPAGLLLVLVMVVPVAVLFCAVLLAVSLYAKSIKEASSYASPMIILIIVPAMMGLLPGLELNARLALVPILNLALVSKELVSGVYHWPYLALIFGSTCLYAAAALAFCVRMFNREDVLFRV
ncbi:MAG TPA: ABC transporter permease subunit [Opitutaceae bacterium]|nr:ABC transporter permease subunit [Opitutaceae bacterium]